MPSRRASRRRSSLALPYGVTTTYTYDALNRLSELESKTSVGETLQGYQYTLGPVGNPTAIAEHDGTSRSYQYDTLVRLTQDRMADPVDALAYQRDFTCDPVGNRLSQTVDEGGGPATVGSVYDVRDRLLSAAGTIFGWDGIALFGSGQDSDGGAAEALADGYEVPALQGSGGDLESGSAGLDMAQWSAHTHIQTQCGSPICSRRRKEFEEFAPLVFLQAGRLPYYGP